LLIRAVERAIFLTLITLLAGVGFLLGSYAPSVQTNVNLAPLFREVGIILVSIGLISGVYELLIRQQMVQDMTGMMKQLLDPDSKRLGIAALYQTRDDKIERGQGLEELIRSTQREMLCLGLGLLAFVPERKSLLRARMEQGCRFRFLLFDAESANASALDVSLGSGDGNLIGFIRTQTKYVREFQKELQEAQLLPQFEVRLYHAVPTFGMVEVDPKTLNNRMVIELYGFKAEGSVCPGASLIETDAGWCAFYRQRAELLWSTAKPLELEA
jgi:uncharacterized protein DUF5919